MNYHRLARSGPLIGYAYSPRTKTLRILCTPNDTAAYRDVTPADLGAFLACRPTRRLNYLKRSFRKQVPA